MTKNMQKTKKRTGSLLFSGTTDVASTIAGIHITNVTQHSKKEQTLMQHWNTC